MALENKKILNNIQKVECRLWISDNSFNKTIFFLLKTSTISTKMSTMTSLISNLGRANQIILKNAKFL